MSPPLWSFFIGLLLITMMLVGTGLPHLFLTGAMIYLSIGYLLGPGGLSVVAPDPYLHAELLESISEIALLISLFTVGLKMGGVAISDPRWRLPLRLAFVSMSVTVGLIALIGSWALDLSPGAAILLGAILAPTDPVLASAIQTEGGETPDRLRFGLAGEGGMNDGTAFPFVLLGLGLLGGEDFGTAYWRWWSLDLLWATGAGIVIGAVMGALIGRLVVHLRTRHRQAVGLDEFLSLGLIAMAYGAAQLCLASGFLAVFAAGILLQRVKEHPQIGTLSLAAADLQRHSYGEQATHSHHAGATMKRAVLDFNEQLEKLAELAAVLLVGAMLSYVTPSLATLWFIPAIFILLRGIAVYAGTIGHPIELRPRMLVCWFGIRGIGSLYYLMFALHHGVSGTLAELLTSLTLTTVAVSIIVHGISAAPIMRWYMKR